jgi:hypothetical protein
VGSDLHPDWDGHTHFQSSAGATLMQPVLLIVGLCFLIAAILMARVLRHRRLGGLPAGEVVLSDTEDEFCPVLVSHRYGLKGKPDAIVRTKSGDYIPVERKHATLSPKALVITI